MALDMLAERNVHLTEFPDKCLYGTFVKKCLVEKSCLNIKTGQSESCLRTETTAISQQQAPSLDFIMSKYHNDQ